MRAALLAVLSATTVTTVAAAARADEPVPPPSVTPLAFPTLGPDGLASQITAQLGVQLFDGADTTVKRFDLQGQVMSKAGTAGGYLALGGAMVEGITAFDNVEVGGLLHTRSGPTDLTVRAGLIVPTASRDDDERFFVGLASLAGARPGDLMRAVPDTTTMRLAVAPTYHSGNLVLRGDVGIDVPLDDGDGDGKIYHLDVAAGYDDPSVGLTAELENVGSTDGDGMLHVLAATGQIRRGKVNPYVTLSMPFVTGDDNNDFGDTINVLGGARFGF